MHICEYYERSWGNPRSNGRSMSARRAQGDSQFQSLGGIACGGTGGHFFPGLAVGQRLLERGCAVILLVSSKELEQQLVREVLGMLVITLPAVGLKRGAEAAFVRAFTRSYVAAR